MKNNHERLLRFTTLGILFGGFIPAGMFLFSNWVGTKYFDSPIIASELPYYIGFGTLMIAAGLSYAASCFNNQKRTDRYLMYAGALSIVSLTGLVAGTGGPMASVFSFHYLYIPVVVGICLRESAQLPLRHSAYKLSALLCWVSCVGCLIVLGFVPWFKPIVEAAGEIAHKPVYILYYLFIFSLQIGITVRIYFEEIGKTSGLPADRVQHNE